MRGVDWEILGGGALVLAAFMLLGGCGPGALGAHLQVARAMHDIQTESEPVLRSARRDAMTAEARRVHDAGGGEAEATDAAFAEGERWTCAVEGHRLYGVAVATYVDEIYLADRDESGLEDPLSRLVPYAGRVVDTWRLLWSCAEELSPGVIPEVPAFLGILPPAWQISTGGAL